jgi:hypothetical protein
MYHTPIRIVAVAAIAVLTAPGCDSLIEPDAHTAGEVAYAEAPGTVTQAPVWQVHRNLNDLDDLRYLRDAFRAAIPTARGEVAADLAVSVGRLNQLINSGATSSTNADGDLHATELDGGDHGIPGAGGPGSPMYSAYMTSRREDNGMYTVWGVTHVETDDAYGVINHMSTPDTDVPLSSGEMSHLG